MSFVFNNIPALSEEFIETMKKVREETTNLKKVAYGEDCNRFDHSVGFYPRNMTLQELEIRLNEILSTEILIKLAEEQRALRSKIDCELAKVVATEILPQLALPGTLFQYDFYVVARDMRQIDSKTDPHRGRRDSQTPIKCLPVEDWKDGAWKEYILLDHRINNGEIDRYMPVGTNRLLSTVHRFYAVNKTDKSKLQIDCRTKSGAEFLYKLVAWLTGIERKPGEPRQDIRDLAALRIIFRDYFEERSIDGLRHFMDNYRGSCEGSVILQILHSNQDGQKVEFLKNLPRKSRSFCEAILDTEERTNILDPEDVAKIEKKYYLEMLIPFFTTCYRKDDVFGRNIINLLTQPRETYKKICEKKDEFLYKGRVEYNRERSWPYFEWCSLIMSAEKVLEGDSLSYINEVTNKQLYRRLRK